jgi:hypothetical protein
MIALISEAILRFGVCVSTGSLMGDAAADLHEMPRRRKANERRTASALRGRGYGMEWSFVNREKTGMLCRWIFG